MAVLLFLLNLPFLLLFLLVLCGRKKKKSNEETPKAPVKIPTASKTSKVSNEPVKPKEPPKEASPSASTSNSKAANKSKASTSHNGNSNSKIEKPIEPKEIKEEETQETSEEREIRLATVIISRHRELKAGIITAEMEQEARDRDKHMGNWRRGVYRRRIGQLFLSANEAYKLHKCTHPKKKRTEDEQCDVCKAYFEFAALIYDRYNSFSRCNYTVSGIIENDFYDYGGKLPIFLENPEWQKVKEQLTKEMGTKMKLSPPAGTSEERERQIDEGQEKLRQIIDYIDYWNSSDDEFKQRIAKDFEETRKVYRAHDCRGLPPDKVSTSYYCHVCSYYVDGRWTGRLYEEVLKNEKRFPDGMKRQLEEDFYFHQQNFQWHLPRVVENRYWIWAKERIVEERAKKETEKKAKNDGNKAKDGSRQI